MIRMDARERHQEWRTLWHTLTFYERFEQVICFVLTALIALIILLATFDLAKEVIALVWYGLFDPRDHQLFQSFFGQIMTLLIALEFKHSILKAAAQREHIIQVKTVLLIALLAISRKFIILDAHSYTSGTILALASVVVALGVTYWLIRNRDKEPGGSASPAR